MCYCKSGCKFNMNSSYWKVMFCNMVVFLVEYELIKIILFKVKELCCYVELLIIFVKNDSVVNCCLVFVWMWSKEVVGKLFIDFGFCYKEWLGGYICIFKCGFCLGDKVLMVYVELVDCLVIVEVVELDD